MTKKSNNSINQNSKTPSIDKKEALEWLRNQIFNKDEFCEILKKSADWKIIDKTTKDTILNSLDNKAVDKILQITISANLFDGAINLAAGGVGLSEILSTEINLLRSPAIMAYFGKLFLTPLIAYLYWKDSTVRKKHRNALMLSVPIAGPIAFPAMTLKDHDDLLKFWSLYKQTKHAYRSALASTEENKTEKEDILRQTLEKEWEFPTTYRDVVGNILEAQGLNCTKNILPKNT